MILQQSKSKEWIMKVREMTPQRDPILIEKMIMALMLVESLSINGLDFVFKGGTSLALMLGGLQRFSIDIDIVISDEQNVSTCFNKIKESGLFHRYEENIRKSDIPKKHYKFYYYSEIENKESHILLDILLEENLYSRLTQVEVSLPILSLGGEKTFLTCPSNACLLGDKLTAFAPNTTGIPYGTGKQLEIIKQLIDIAMLFDVVDELDLVHKTHSAIAGKELTYRGMSVLSQNDVLQDTLNTGLIIALRGHPDRSEEFSELLDGIKRVGGFLYSGNFTIDKAILCASKATILAAYLIKKENIIRKLESRTDISELLVQHHSYQKINKLKKTNPEAFYYFYHALDILDLT